MKNYLRIKKYLYGSLFLSALSALLLTACQQDEAIEDIIPDTPTGETEGVTLHFTVAGELSALEEPASTRTNAPGTRTVLPGSANVQHVTAVQLYVFNGTSDNSLCVASEDIGWSANFGGIPPTITASMKYHVKYSGFVKGNPYTFLAVGTDATSRTTYGFPAAIQVNTTTLVNALANLSGTEASTWMNMRQSEFFAGSTVLTPSSYGTQGNVDLWRRVAGVMGWFVNVPTSVGATAVSAIRISLYAQQNKSVPLIQRSQAPVFKDFITSPLSSTGGQVLVQIPVPIGTLPVTVLSAGSYVLPVVAPPSVNTNDYTLRVELVSAAGTILRSNRITLSGTNESSPGNGTGIIDPQGVYRFPIIANRFYGVGSPLTPINLNGIVIRASIRASVITEWKESIH